MHMFSLDANTMRFRLFPSTRNGNPMNATVVNQVIEILEKLKDIELSLAEFYETCSVAFSEQVTFFHTLNEEEKKHAVLISELIDVVRNGKLEGVPGRFKLPALNVYLEGIRASVAKVKNGKLSLLQVLTLAMDYEKSIVEKKFFEAIQSTSSQYDSVKLLLGMETKEHYQRIVNRIEALKHA